MLDAFVEEVEPIEHRVVALEIVENHFKRNPFTVYDWEHTSKYELAIDCLAGVTKLTVVLAPNVFVLSFFGGPDGI